MTTTRSASTKRAVWRFTDAEWRLARIARANVLFVGPDALSEKIVEALWPDFSQPIEVWRRGSRLVLPPVGHSGTLILRDIEAMARDDQRRLCDWLEVTAGGTRVVSTTPEPLIPLLEAGTFCDTLYYRLNTLCFQLAECEN